MTKDNYLEHLAEKINEGGVGEIQLLPALRLVLAYNRRYIDPDKVAEFDDKMKAEYLATYTEASVGYYSNDKARLESVIARVLGWCDPDIAKAYSLGKDHSARLYNVHTLVSGCEAIDKKESIKAARKIADYSFETSEMKKYYIDAQQAAEFNSKAIYDTEIFQSLYSRVPGMKEEVFKARLQSLAEQTNQSLITEENKYFPRIVEELVAETVRLTNSANEMTLKAS